MNPHKSVPVRAIIFITSNPVWGGSEELWSRTAITLAQSGHAVSAFVGREFDLSLPNLRSLAEAGGSIRRLVAPDWWPRKVVTACHLFWPLTNRLMRANLASAFQKSSPDLAVISQGLNHDGWLLASVCRENGVPYVLISQKADDMYWPADEFRSRIQLAYSSAAASYFVSEHNHNATEEQIGLRLASARIVRNPYNARWDAIPTWPQDEGFYWLACPARLDAREKGQDLLLRVLSQDKWKRRPLGVRFFGKGPNAEGLREMAELLAVRNVDFAGFTTSPSELWQSHHGLILPSRCEGLPLTVVEAMLNHRMVVVCDTGGTSEVVHDNRDGFVAGAATETELDKALERAWAQRVEWRDLGIAAGRSIRMKVPSDPPRAFAKELMTCIRDR